jgi:YesN/AraC family two-component response regulator
MQFINEKTVACIKIYLIKELPLEEIANLTKLGNTSSLGRFFKKETGLTLLEYKCVNS